MEIFLPSQEAARVKIGADFRIVLDYSRDRVIGGRVTFVSPEAQFTPKQVETRKERDKLMFRVKIQVPGELVTYYIQHVKTGVRGVGYVKGDASVAWPAWLQNVVAAPETQPSTEPADSGAQTGADVQKNTASPQSSPSSPRKDAGAAISQGGGDSVSATAGVAVKAPGPAAPQEPASSPASR